LQDRSRTGFVNDRCSQWSISVGDGGAHRQQAARGCRRQKYMCAPRCSVHVGSTPRCASSLPGTDQQFTHCNKQLIEQVALLAR
jgi:hypothetical protein